MMKFILLILTATLAPALPQGGLLLDLNAETGLILEEGDRVASWENQAKGARARFFVKQDKGRSEMGSGRPTLRRGIAELGGKSSVVFQRQELVCDEEDAFDHLTTGKGHTWLAIIAVHPQRDGLKDVNSIFGNLRNGGRYEGIWACLNDDNRFWYGSRNGLTFGRFDENNPQLLGPVLETGKFHIVGGRMAAGTGSVKIELFAHSPAPFATRDFPVVADANPSRMAVGQERDAVEHPGYESFDGEIARLLIWERPLDDAELKTAWESLSKEIKK